MYDKNSTTNQIVERVSLLRMRLIHVMKQRPLPCNSIWWPKRYHQPQQCTFSYSHWLATIWFTLSYSYC